jgi:hypothetical protein
MAEEEKGSMIIGLGDAQFPTKFSDKVADKVSEEK